MQLSVCLLKCLFVCVLACVQMNINSAKVITPFTSLPSLLATARPQARRSLDSEMQREGCLSLLCLTKKAKQVH